MSKCKEESSSSDEGHVAEILPLFQRLRLHTLQGIKPKDSMSKCSATFVLPTRKTSIPKDYNSGEHQFARGEPKANLMLVL